MPKNWIEINAEGPREKADIASWLLIDAGSPGIVEAGAGLPQNTLVSFSVWEDETREEENQSPSAVYKAYLEAPSPQELKKLAARLESIGWRLTASAFRDRDWSVEWMSRIRPVRVTYKGASCVVKPTWREVKRRPGDVIIEIDPGMAFGTGSHETTKMCLRALMMLLKLMGRKEARKYAFLDIGTGTGVLAIAAKKLGVKRAVGVDIDPVALKVARKNARLNRVAVTISRSSAERVKGVFPLVAANILAGELIRLAPVIDDKTAEGGFLILSGVLAHERERVKEAYLSRGFKGFRDYGIGEWSASVLRKTTP